MTANSRVNAFKDVRSAPLDQDNGSQPAALLLMVLMGDTIWREEQSPFCDPSIFPQYTQVLY